MVILACLIRFRLNLYERPAAQQRLLLQKRQEQRRRAAVQGFPEPLLALVFVDFLRRAVLLRDIGGFFLALRPF